MLLACQLWLYPLDGNTEYYHHHLWYWTQMLNHSYPENVVWNLKVIYILNNYYNFHVCICLSALPTILCPSPLFVPKLTSIPEGVSQHFTYKRCLFLTSNSQTNGSAKSAKEFNSKFYCHYTVQQWLTLPLTNLLCSTIGIRFNCLNWEYSA